MQLILLSVMIHIRAISALHVWHAVPIGKQVMERKVVQLRKDIERGTVDETKAVGILEQWLIKGKLTQEESLTQACDLLSAGLDNVS